jgi:hypothetical protein
MAYGLRVCFFCVIISKEHLSIECNIKSFRVASFMLEKLKLNDLAVV